MTSNKTADWYTICVALFAAIGTFLFGFDTGIATTTIAHASFLKYMNNPSSAMTGAVVSVYIAGEAFGAITQIIFGDKLGRLRFMQMMSAIVTIGCIIQTVAVDFPMYLVGRVLAGFAVGGLVGTVPIYLSEISAPHSRGLIGGLSGCGISFGTAMSNWVGFACQYAPYGSTQWRLPLGLQIPWGIILLTGLMTFMPDSPRALIRSGRIEAARLEFLSIRRDLSPHEVSEEFALMHNQIEFEMMREVTGFREMWKLYKHRMLVAVSANSLTALTGINVISYYQTILYTSFSLSPNTILALSGVYGTVGLITNLLTTRFLTDKWGRRNLILTGLFSITLILTYTSLMQMAFQDSTSTIGKSFAIAGIFIFSCAYYGLLNSTTWLYAAEVLPLHLRSRGLGAGALGHFIINVAITEAGPTAFRTIRQNYYWVFVACSALFSVAVWFWFPETKQKSLEEIAAAFGDTVVSIDAGEIAKEQGIFEEKAGVVHREETGGDV